jgi:VWFA-related protein
MRRISGTSAALLLLLALAFSGLPLAAQMNAGASPFLEQVEVEVVNVDVRATDSSGQPVLGLGKGDFELLEDGKPVAITNFAAIADQRAGERPATTAIAVPPAPAIAKTPAGSATTAPAPEIPEEQRFHLVVYIDNWNLQPAHRARVLGPLRRFLADKLAATDRVMLVTYDQGLHVRLPFTSDRAAVADALDRAATLGTVSDLESQRRSALRVLLDLRKTPHIGPCGQQLMQPVESYAETTRQEVLRSIRGLRLLVSSLSGVPGKKAVLHVSDGLQLTPGQDLYEVLNQLCGGVANGLPDATDARIAGDPTDNLNPSELALDAQHYNTANEWRKLTDQANAQGVPFYTLQASGLTGNASASAEYEPDEQVLQLPAIDSVFRANLRDTLSVLASETGGQAIFDANDPTADLVQARADFDRYYSLGYSPAHHGDGKAHRIEVRVKRRGVRLRYRQGYRDKPALERAVDRTLATLLHGFADNPLEVELTAQAGMPASKGVFRVPVRLRIPLFKLAILNRDEAFAGHLRLLVLTRDGADRISPVRQVDVPIQIPKSQLLNAMGQYYAYDLSLDLPPGPHRLAIAVRDEFGGATSYLGEDLQVGEPVKAANP